MFPAGEGYLTLGMQHYIKFWKSKNESYGQEGYV